MKATIERIMRDFVPAKKETFTGHPIGKFFRNDIPNTIYGTGVVDSSKYLVEGSVGKGNWAIVPWVCIFDRSITTSATKGVYIVYLLAADGKTLYLTFNQGCTDIRKNNSKAETIKIMRRKAAEIVARIDSRGFRSDEEINLGDRLTELGEMYQRGTIFYKAYRVGAVPSSDVLVDDLKKMMDIYKEFAANPSPKNPVTPHPVGNFDSWEIVDDKTAIKTCDKSFFEHNGSGVPKEICWFFDADTLLQNNRAELRFNYNGSSYVGRVSNDTTDRRRVRIFWNADLGRLFNVYKDKNVKAKFTKTAQGTYEITIIGGEKDVTIKDQVSEIVDYISGRGFNYEGQLIENFYLALKSKPFVILAGTSGTGKTRLVSLFAEAIGAKYQLVSVRPDWSDSSDLFGHVDLNQKFVPGAVIQFVKDAENDPSTPYFLCLDEMNLARVEYYMSDILSAIETRKFANGRISTAPVVKSTNYGNDVAAAQKYGNVILPGNLFIVGTVNMDETTFPFSKKVLDRANTIEFSYVDLLALPNFDTSELEPQKLTSEFLQADYLIINDCGAENAAYIAEVCDLLQSVNRILEKAGAHIGYRVRDEIVFYMLNNRKTDLLDEVTAFDNQIMQKILPRIQGSAESIKDMLEELLKLCESKNYEACINKIKFMIKRYNDDGFTSYWI